jgi:hypothetical protein
MNRRRGRHPPRDVAVKWQHPKPKILIEAADQLAREDILEDFDNTGVDTERGWMEECIRIVHSAESLPADKIKGLLLIEKVKGWSKNKEADLEKMSDDELMDQLIGYMIPTLKALEVMAVR